MSWDCMHVKRSKNAAGKIVIDRKATVDGAFERSHFTVIKSRMVGSVYYGAIRNDQTGNTFGAVVLTTTRLKDQFNFGVKIMEETMGPCYYDCPAFILNLLPDTDNKLALEWRERCRKHTAAKNTLSKLSIGTKIRFQFGDKMLEYYKHEPAFQFKKPFWFNDEQRTYIRPARIPDDYEIVSAAQ